MDGEFDIPNVEIPEDLLWKVKSTIGEYMKFISAVQTTIEDSAPDEADSVKGRISELKALLEKLDELKPTVA